MNGSELEMRSARTNPLLADESIGELTDIEKMDLMVGDDSPYAKALKKLMRTEVANAREEALDCDPSDEKKQKALLDIAHAMKKFYMNIQGAILFEKTKHLADVKQKIAEEELKDQEKIEEIILANQTH